MRQRVLKLKTFEAATAAALDAAYEAWRAALGEEVFVESRLSYDGTNIIFTVLYTTGG